MKNISNSNAFTLIEVILAISILSTLSVLSTQALSRALKARIKIQAEVDDVSGMRDAMRLMRTDLNLAFHHRDFEAEISTLLKKKSTQPGQQFGQQPGQFGAPVGNGFSGNTGFNSNPNDPDQNKRQTKRYDPSTQFDGETDKVNFVTLNNGRIMANLVQADFIEVGYSLKECKNLTTNKTSKCLYRRTQNILDEDVTTGGQEMVLLENLSEFKLRYIGEGKQEWASTWKSAATGIDESTKNKFPDAVEISFTVEHEVESKKRTYSMQYIVPIHFPNNSDKNSSSNNSTTSPAGINQ